MKRKYILFFIILLTSCKQKREVGSSFYYWKTVYQQQQIEDEYLNELKCNKIYVRMMDVDLDFYQKTVPIAPIEFKDSIPPDKKLVPVVFVVNDALRNQTDAQLVQLAHNILAFVKVKVLESGKYDYDEIQVDCDWTQTTRDNYFFLLKSIKKFNSGRILSSTLRLHQLKNQLKSGIPPVDRVLLMCYNMGNLRQFGAQNSILEVNELKKYVNQNLANYPMPVDIALPLFSWAVVFEGTKYAGISKRIALTDLENKKFFRRLDNGLYQAITPLPDFGVRENSTIRFEESKLDEVSAMAEYLSAHLSGKPINLVYYHLDHKILKKYKIHELEEITHLLR